MAWTDEPTEPYTGPEITPGDRLEFGAGATIGRYQIQRMVGHGGMGMVVAAHDPELGRSVAIKLVASDSEDARARLVREAQAMAKLSHPNVVTVHEVMRLGDRAAIVMELVDGHDLATWRAEAPRTWRQIVDAYVQAARGLAAAHRAGLIHRDFKPSNALIDRDGVVRVTDFGLVRTATRRSEPTIAKPGDPAAAGGLDAALTRTGARVGTPAYMAPEQHLGEAVDARTDQWALGCSLYEALYGQRPFAGSTYDQIAAAVGEGAIRPEPADTRVPRAIRAAIRRALARRPEDRFAAMDELIAALTPPRRAWQIAAAAGAVAAVGAIVFAVVSRGESAASCTDLDAPFTAVWNPTRARLLETQFRGSGLAYATVAADGVSAGLDRYRGDWVTARTRACTDGRRGVASHDLLDRRMRCLDQRLAEAGALVDAMIVGDARAVERAGNAVDRLHPIEDCTDPRETVPRPADAAARSQIDEAERELAQASALHGLGEFERALPLAQRAVDVANQTGWSPLLARALVLTGSCHNRMKQYDAAVADLELAATAAAKASDDATLAEALAAKFFVIGEPLGRPGDALATRPFVELALERAGQPKRQRALWLHNLAVVLLGQEKFDDALAAEIEAVSIWRTLGPIGHGGLVDSLETQGNVRIYRGEFDQAKALLDEVLASEIAARGPEHPTVGSIINNLGVLEAMRGDLPAAVGKWEQALAIQRAAGVDAWSDAYNLGFARYELGRWTASVAELTRSVEHARKESTPESRNVAMAETGLGAALIVTGDLERATATLDHAIVAAEKSGTPHDDTVAFAALAALRRGDLAAARTRIAQAAALREGGSAMIALIEAELARATAGCKAARPAYERVIPAAEKEPAVWVVTAATVGLGECQLELGAAADAVKTLEPRVAWQDQVAADPAAAAPGRFALARAIRATRGDAARARALAEAARDGFAALGASGAARVAAVERWLGGR